MNKQKLTDRGRKLTTMLAEEIAKMEKREEDDYIDVARLVGYMQRVNEEKYYGSIKESN